MWLKVTIGMSGGGRHSQTLVDRLSGYAGGADCREDEHDCSRESHRPPSISMTWPPGIVKRAPSCSIIGAVSV